MNESLLIAFDDERNFLKCQRIVIGSPDLTGDVRP